MCVFLWFLRPAPKSEVQVMADEIGFHAIWDERFHNVRPTTLASGSPDAASGESFPERELCYAGIVPSWFRR